MDNRIVKTLNDILSAINEIESFFSIYPKRFDVFCSNTLLSRGIQMNIAIIGEATNRILKINPQIKITKARKIVDTRNYLIHGYDSVSPDMLWAIVIKHLPLLKSEVLEILSESGQMSSDDAFSGDMTE